MWSKLKKKKERVPNDTRTHLKNRILVQDRGGAEFQTGGILLYVEDLKRGTNKDIGPKDIFEMGSIICHPTSTSIYKPGDSQRLPKVIS